MACYRPYETGCNGLGEGVAVVCWSHRLSAQQLLSDLLRNQHNRLSRLCNGPKLVLACTNPYELPTSARPSLCYACRSTTHQMPQFVVNQLVARHQAMRPRGAASLGVAQAIVMQYENAEDDRGVLVAAGDSRKDIAPVAEE